MIPFVQLYCWTVTLSIRCILLCMYSKYCALVSTITGPICISWEYIFSRCCQSICFIYHFYLESFTNLARQTFIEDLFWPRPSARFMRYWDDLETDFAFGRLMVHCKIETRECRGWTEKVFLIQHGLSSGKLPEESDPWINTVGMTGHPEKRNFG